MLELLRFLFIVGLLTPSIANSASVSIDFSKLPDGSNALGLTVTDQYKSLGVIFSGLGNSVYSGAVFYGNGSSVAGLTHSIEGPFPWSNNGIVANFLEPIVSIDVDVFGGRIGSTTNIYAFNLFGALISQTSYYQADFYKGHANLSFNEAVSKVIWKSTMPYSDTVGIRNLSFTTVPTASTLWLLGSGLIAMSKVSKRKRVNLSISHSV